MELPEYTKLLAKLVSYPQETEWIEFKHNFHSEEEIGQRLSALSNSAALLNEPFGYLVFGIEDGTHAIVGTSFKAKRHKKGNEELEMWLLNRLNNKSLRERLGVDEKNYPLVSVVIKEALAQGLIKIGTPEGINRRDIAYIPHWG